MPAIDLVGQVFERLRVVSRESNSAGGSARWLCICDCGGETVSYGQSLRRGAARSCGCLQKEVVRKHAHRAHASSTTHAMSRTPEYRARSGMLSRCYNPKVPNYSDYGGRGIVVCQRWRDSFEAFLVDMGPRPTPKHSIDRIDNNGSYDPGNCRWATDDQQNNNTRANRRVTFRGDEMTLSEAIAAAGLSVSPLTVHTRLHRGWSLERALS